MGASIRISGKTATVTGVDHLTGSTVFAHDLRAGAALVIAGCGGFGFSIASGYKREEGILRQLLRALNYMEWELQYRLTAWRMNLRKPLGGSEPVQSRFLTIFS